MYDLHFSEEQIAIRDTVRDFVAQEITPIAQRPERIEPFDTPLDTELLATASELGLRALALPEEVGGAGSDTLTCCLVAEELGAGDTDIAMVLAQTAALGGVLFNRLMSDTQRDTFLPAFVEDGAYHLALADAEAGTDTLLGVNYHGGLEGAREMTTRAVADGDGNWTVNGVKTRIANAPVAKLFIVAAVTDAGPVLLLVPADTPGVTVAETERMDGWYLGSCGDITFADCRVPAGNVLDGADFDALAAARLPIVQAVDLGIGRAALEAAVDYAKLRVQGSRPIIEHQAIGGKLAEVAINLQAARNMVWKAAWAADHPEAVGAGSLDDLPHALVAQVAASEMIYRATKDSAECFGAMGVMRDMPLQKYIQDSRIFLHTGNGNTDAKLRIAEALAAYER